MNARCAANIKALKLYNRVDVQIGIEDASPHRLIQMLMDGALQRIRKAKSAMHRNETEEKGVNLSMAISIIGGLRDSLDHDVGGEIAANLDSLYEYMTITLIEANASNDTVKLDEVAKLLVQIKSAWDAIEGQESTPTPAHSESRTLMQQAG